MKDKQPLLSNKSIRRIYTNASNAFYSVLTVISPELNTKVRYRRAFGKKLDLVNPVTLNEKVLWLKLKKYMKNPLVIQCADKYRVREYVQKCGCGEILNELIGVYKKVDDIPWEELPNQFVLKWNFGAGMNIVCTNKNEMNKDEALRQLKKWGKTRYWLTHSEMQYKYMKKMIVCEKLLDGEE